MKRFLTLFAVALTCMSLFAATAEAKRFGGGGSFGKQRSVTPQQPAKSPAAAPAPAQTPSAAPAKPGNRWIGPLAGLAAGLGLAALASHFGFGEEMGVMLMVILAVVAVMFLVAMLRRKQQPAMQYAGAGAPMGGAGRTDFATSGAADPATVSAPSTIAAASSSASIPADFPVENFLRNAKTSFIRLQAANDRKDLDDIREYTTPEVFAEISMQMQERGDAPQKTEVVSIHAELLEVANERDYAIASVRFTGQLSENGGAPESVDEIWHVQKDLRDANAVWLLAGIQQTTLH